MSKKVNDIKSQIADKETKWLEYAEMDGGGGV